MFIYAATRAAQIKYFNGDGKILFSGKRFFDIFDRETSYNYLILLKNFQICSSAYFLEDFSLPIDKKILKKICGYRFCKNQQEVYKKAVRTSKILQKFGVVSCEDGYIRLAEKMPDTIYMDSFFQSEQYFLEIKPLILEEFTLKNTPPKSIRDFAQYLTENETVCLAIRLTDYLNNPLHQVCTVEYYQKAIYKMQQYKPNCQFILFSDDIAMAKSLFVHEKNVIEEPMGCSEAETLWLMSCCKHFIISNSSFHWWGQYLSRNKEKIVIAPSRWYAEDVPCALYQMDWETIDV